MIDSIINAGGFVQAYDPVSNKPMQKLFPGIGYCKTWQEAVTNVDFTVIMTEWNEFRGMNLKQLKELSNNCSVLDTRNMLNMDELNKLGITFDNVGRLKP